MKRGINALQGALERAIERSNDDMLTSCWDDVGSDGWEDQVDGPDWGDTAP